MLGILGALGGSLVMGTIKSLGETAITKYIGHLQSKAYYENEAEERRTKVAIEELENYRSAMRNSRDIRLATAGFWEMRILTVAIALPFVWHLWLVFLDTIWWRTASVDALPAPFDQWQGSILLSFFGIGVVALVANRASSQISQAIRGSGK